MKFIVIFSLVMVALVLFAEVTEAKKGKKKKASGDKGVGEGGPLMRGMMASRSLLPLAASFEEPAQGVAAEPTKAKKAKGNAKSKAKKGAGPMMKAASMELF